MLESNTVKLNTCTFSEKHTLLAVFLCLSYQADVPEMLKSEPCAFSRVLQELQCVNESIKELHVELLLDVGIWQMCLFSTRLAFH